MENTDSLNNEFPLLMPYEFEGFTKSEETLKLFINSLGVKAITAQNGISVVRDGQNAYGTWGSIFTWDGSNWIHKGYTLEPRSNIGKGPIPIGDYIFNHWDSPKLGKTLRLHNVPGFTDILIHVGNKQNETTGCILAANKIDNPKVPTQLLDSRTLTDWLYDNQVQGVVQVRSK